MKKIIFIIFLLVISTSLTGCNSKEETKKRKEIIKEKLEVNTEERTFKVNKVIYATDTITINEIKMNVKNDTVTLGNYNKKFNGEKILKITGYYDQAGAIYNIYILSEDSNGKTSIWEMKRNNSDSLEKINWVNKYIDNATELILIDCTETDNQIGQTPLRYQVYTLVNNELVLIS